jgi:uncharacterized protein YbaR (Trm112 family)
MESEFLERLCCPKSGQRLTLDTPKTVMRWLEDAGLEQVEVLKAGHLVGRGVMPHAPRY